MRIGREKTTLKVMRMKMNKLWKNWTIHNLIGHPISEIAYLVSLPFAGKEKAENISGWIHDLTIPDHAIETGRG